MKITDKYLKTLSPEIAKQTILKEYFKCSTNWLYMIETYFTVMADTTRVPFILYPHQVVTLEAYLTYTNNILMKTRQMGLTTFSSAYAACELLFENNHKSLIISKTKEDAKAFLKTIKDILDNAREECTWLICDYEKNYNNKESFMLKNGSFIKAESASEDAGRGTQGLKSLYIDEAAFIDRRSPGKMSEIWSAVSPALATTKGKTFVISTPKGTSGWYYDTYTSAHEIGFHIIDAHWTTHPIYSQGQYQWVEDATAPEGGTFNFFGKEWPETLFDKKTGTYIKLNKKDYPFVCDGKIRSPWYDFNSIKLGPRLTKCELDCSFTGTGGEVLDSDLLREMKVIADSTPFTNPYEHLKSGFRKYKEFIAYVPGHTYVIAADVATGDGSDFSTFVIIDLTTFEICGTFKEQILPTAFATVLYTIGKDFGGCPMVIENQGGGYTTLQTLKVKGYPSIYYSTLNKKDPSTGLRKRKIGLWCSEDVRMQGGDQVEEKLRTNQIKIPCAMLVEEFYNWIWDKDQKRRHAPGKNDDLIMALQHALWYSMYVYKRSERNRDNFKKIFEVQRNTKTIKLSDQPYGKGTIIRTDTQFSSQQKIAITGNIDRMNDPRVLSQSELEHKTQANGKRRMFI